MRFINFLKKAVVVHETGSATSPKSLVYETDYPKPELKPGYAIIQNTFAGINFIDTYHRSGLYPRAVPFICGQEGGGNIISIEYEHDDDDNKKKISQEFKIGDTVVYSSFGSYAEYTLVPIQKLISVPSTVDIRSAIACMVQGLTAHYLVSSAHAQLIQPNEWCLIYSIASGTGQWTAQMAKIRGYKVIGTCSKSKLGQISSGNGNSNSNSVDDDDGVMKYCDELIVLDEVEGMGYSDYTSVDIVDRVMKCTNGEGVKCVIDGVGRSTSDISLTCLARRGIFISFGNASGKVDDMSLLRLVGKSAYVTRPKLNDYVSTREELVQRMDEVLRWISSGQLEVSIDQEFDLKDAVAGHEYIEAGRTRGKLLFRI